MRQKGTNFTHTGSRVGFFLFLLVVLGGASELLLFPASAQQFRVKKETVKICRSTQFTIGALGKFQVQGNVTCPVLGETTLEALKQQGWLMSAVVRYPKGILIYLRRER